MFGRYVPASGQPNKRAYRRVAAGDPFREVRAIVSAADIAFANLETPVLVEPKEFSTTDWLTFRAEESDLVALRSAGFDVLNLANNHAADFGLGAAARTRESVLRAGFGAVGAGKDETMAAAPQIVTVKGMRIAFLAFTTWTNGNVPIGPGGAVSFVEEQDLVRRAVPAVLAARAVHRADFVVLSLHWGNEYRPHPEDLQRKQARFLSDCGADVILGSHPHVWQDVEIRNGRVIAYSLGNFLFDSETLARRETAVLRVVLEGTGKGHRVASASLVPVLLGRSDHVPRPATGTSGAALTARLGALAPGCSVGGMIQKDLTQARLEGPTGAGGRP